MYKEKILNQLRASGAEFCSGEELARKAGISRTMVWKHVKSLERDGFGIEAVSSRGYRIISVPDLILPNDLRHGLGTKIVGRELHYYSSTESTNTLAMEMAVRGAPQGTTVVAETQTKGRGRRGRTWISPKGNLHFSVILRPDIPLHKAPLITLMGAVATAAAINRYCAVPARIKWPNDIIVAGKKTSGLLTEMSAEQDRIRHIVLGIGVDVNMDPGELPAELRETTTTLRAESGAAVDRTQLLREILRELDRWYGVFLDDPAEVLREWDRLNITVSRRVAVDGAGETFEGTALGIDSEGRLLVRQDDGSVRTVAAGDVTLRK